MAKAGQTGVSGVPALSASYQTYFDADVDGRVGSMSVTNTGATTIFIKITPHHVTPAAVDFPLAAGASQLFRGRVQSITKLEMKGNGNTADFGAVEV